MRRISSYSNVPRRCVEKVVCRRQFIQRLDVGRHPLELQLRFERIFDRLRWSDVGELQKQLRLPRKHIIATNRLSAERRVEQVFADILRTILYRGQPRGNLKSPGRKTDTLSLVAAAIRYDANRPASGRKIARVITFNVDDLLERVVNAGQSRRSPRAFPVRWSSDTNNPRGKRAIPIYHLHGFVPLHPELYPFYSRDEGRMEVPLPLESLVFTDEQYWRAMGNPGDFASRVFAQALGGTCVFLGVSMTDINLLRWLAQHSIEVKRDIQYMTDSWEDSFQTVFAQFTELSSHYWITEGSSDWNRRDESDVDADVLKEVLSTGRGVQCIHIPCWDSKEFRDLWKSCFLSD